MTRGKLFLKAASFTLLISFIVQDFSFAAGEIKPAALNLFEKPKVSLKFPDSVARVEDSYEAQNPARHFEARRAEKSHPKTSVNEISHPFGVRNDKVSLVYLIQDAHTNTSGQINLSKALDHLLKEDK